VDSERTYYHRLTILINGFKQPLLDFIDLELQRLGSPAPSGPASTATISYSMNSATSNSSATWGHDRVRPTAESAVLVRSLFGNVEQLKDLAQQLLQELDLAVQKEEHIGPVRFSSPERRGSMCS